MKTFVAKFQIGKQGLTDNLIETINSAFKKRQQVRVSVLKSCREKQEIKDLAEEIKKRLNTKCNSRVLGFTIILIKTRQ